MYCLGSLCIGGYWYFTLSQRIELSAANSFNKSVNLTPGGASYSSVKCVVAFVQWPLSLMSHEKSQGPLCARNYVGQCVVEGASK